MINGIFTDIGIVIIIATIGAIVAKLVKQPLIPAYVLTGLLIGPVLGLITNMEVISTLSEIGIAFMLFIVGLEIDFKRLRNVAFVSSIGGIILIFVMFAIGVLVAMGFGFRSLSAAYMGLILSFSSTMVVIKLLSDKKELETLHGRMVLGILLMEDLFAIVAMTVLTSINTFSFLVILGSFVKGLILIGAAYFVGRYLFPALFKMAAKSQELLMLCSIAVCFLFALLFNQFGNIVLALWNRFLPGVILHEIVLKTLSAPGFSIAIGAFIAGVTLGHLPYNVEIEGKVRSLRDFFSTIFFVSLGMGLVMTDFTRFIIPLIVFFLIVVMIKPGIIMAISSFFGYKKRPSFLTAVTLAQSSEFSLIIVAQGLALGHISNNIFSFALILAMSTFIVSTYFIKYDNQVYQKFSKRLSIFEKLSTTPKHFEHMPKRRVFKVILCGYNRIGYSVVKTLKKVKKSLLVVDFNPEVVRDLIEEKVHCMYGDVGDTEVIERMGIKTAQILISTVPDKFDNLLLIKKAKQINKKIIVMVTGSQVEEALEMYEAGADYVILPHFLGGEHISLMINEYQNGDFKDVLKNKISHIEELHRRRKMGHRHPKHK